RNNLYGKMGYGVVHPDGSNHFIEDNHYSSNMIGKEVGNLNAPMITFGNLTTDKQDGVIQYKNNKAEGLRSAFIQVGGISEFNNLIIEDNDVLLRSQSISQPTYFINHGFELLELNNFIMRRNTIKNEKGIYTAIRDDISIDYNTSYFDFIKPIQGKHTLKKWSSGGGISNV